MNTSSIHSPQFQDLLFILFSITWHQVCLKLPPRLSLILVSNMMSKKAFFSLSWKFHHLIYFLAWIWAGPEGHHNFLYFHNKKPPLASVPSMSCLLPMYALSATQRFCPLMRLNCRLSISLPANQHLYMTLCCLGSHPSCGIPLVGIKLYGIILRFGSWLIDKVKKIIPTYVANKFGLISRRACKILWKMVFKLCRFFGRETKDSTKNLLILLIIKKYKFFLSCNKNPIYGFAWSNKVMYT